MNNEMEIREQYIQLNEDGVLKKDDDYNQAVRVNNNGIKKLSTEILKALSAILIMLLPFLKSVKSIVQTYYSVSHK